MTNLIVGSSLLTDAEFFPGLRERHPKDDVEDALDLVWLENSQNACRWTRDEARSDKENLLAACQSNRL